MTKGSMKGAPKGKGKLGLKGSGPSVMMTQPSSLGKGKGFGSSSNKPGYTGCFICGGKNHDYRSCRKRGGNKQSSQPGSSHGLHGNLLT